MQNLGTHREMYASIEGYHNFILPRSIVFSVVEINRSRFSRQGGIPASLTMHEIIANKSKINEQ